MWPYSNVSLESHIGQVLLYIIASITAHPSETSCEINSITKSYILNIKIRPLMTEYALTIKLVGGTSAPLV
jgi:hypothetical protein